MILALMLLAAAQSAPAPRTEPEILRDLPQARRDLEVMRETGAWRNQGAISLEAYGLLLDTVADHLLRGDGLPQDRDQALRRFQESWNLTHSEVAALALGRAWLPEAEQGRRPWPEVLEWLARGGPQGRLLAATALLEGRPGLAADRAAGLEQLRTAGSDRGPVGRGYPGWREAREAANLQLGCLLMQQSPCSEEILRRLADAGEPGRADLVRALAALPCTVRPGDAPAHDLGPWRPLAATRLACPDPPAWANGNLLATQVWGRLPDPALPAQGAEWLSGDLRALGADPDHAWVLTSSTAEESAVALVTLDPVRHQAHLLAHSPLFALPELAPVAGGGTVDDTFAGSCTFTCAAGPARLLARAGTRRLLRVPTMGSVFYAGPNCGICTGGLILDVQGGEITPLLHLPQSWTLSLQLDRGMVETSGHWRISLVPGAGSYPELRLDPGPTRFRWNEAEGRYRRVK